MIAVLLNIIILCVVLGLLYWLITLLPIPPQFKQIINVAFILIAILLVLGFAFGGWGGGLGHLHSYGCP